MAPDAAPNPVPKPPESPRAFITGCAGPEFSPDERNFMRNADPWGLILFKRNCQTPRQIRRLTDDFRDITGRADAPILIDQEGGRVQRLGPPDWPKYPPAAVYGALYARDQQAGLDACRLGARLMAHDLHGLGISVDCLPVLDVPAPGGHDIIGDRAYGDTPAQVSALAAAAVSGLMAGGVLPVVKHIPGHGRAGQDSHVDLPRVSAALSELEAVDFAPFRALNGAPMAMTAHVVFDAVDTRAPATLSAKIIADIIRGTIGFDGLLMSDDLSMKALSGCLGARAHAALEAGCDMLLHCNGALDEMEAVAEAAPRLAGERAARAARALAHLRAPDELDLEEARHALSRLIGESVSFIA